jgi:hypothetical protein
VGPELKFGAYDPAYDPDHEPNHEPDHDPDHEPDHRPQSVACACRIRTGERGTDGSALPFEA